MPLTGVTTVIVTGKFRDGLGAALEGKVKFTPSVRFVDASEIVPPEAVTVTLANGDFSVALPVSDDPDLSPTGWTWEVDEQIPNHRRSYSILLSTSLGATVDLTDLAPVDPVEPSAVYALSDPAAIAIAVAAHVNDATDAHDASAISIADVANDFTATDVEGALAELQADAEADATALSDHLADVADAHDASAISIADVANDFTATDVEGALAELQADAEADATALSDHLADVADAHDASAISFAPTGALASSDVQAALAELDTEKSSTSHDHSATYQPLAARLTTLAGRTDATEAAALRTAALDAVYLQMVAPPSGDATGVTDTPILQAALVATAVGGRTILSGGHYYINDEVLYDSLKEVIGFSTTIVEQVGTNKNGFVSRNYRAAQGISPTGHASLRGFRIILPTGSTGHGVIHRDYWSKIIEVEVEGGTDGIKFSHTDDAAAALGGTLVENRIEKCKAKGFAGIGYNLGAADNNQLTDGYFIDCIADAGAGATNHASIGASSGWRIDGIHTYNAVSGSSLVFRNGYKNNIGALYVEQWGSGAAAVDLLNVQRSVSLDQVSVTFPNASVAAAIRITKSGAFTGPTVVINALHAVQTNAVAAYLISNDSLATIVKIGQIIVEGSSASLITFATGTGAASVTTTDSAVAKPDPAIKVLRATDGSTLTTSLVAIAGAWAVIDQTTWTIPDRKKLQVRLRAVASGLTASDVFGAQLFDAVTSAAVIAETTTVATDGNGQEVVTAWTDAPAAGTVWRVNVKVRNQTGARGTPRESQLEFRFADV